MKAAAFEYRRPASTDEALALLQAGEGRAKAMAGGQSLGPMLNLRLTRPAVIVDIAGLAALRFVRETAAGLEIGAGVTHAELEDGVHPPLRGHPVRAVAAGIAYRAIRNRGTVGGSLAHADPAADWIVVMTALGARVAIESPRGSREVPMDAFMQGAYTTVLESDALITAVTLPRLAPDARWGYYKICRKPGEFAEASAAVLFEASTRTARIVLGALDGPPCQLAGLAASVGRDGAHAADRPAVLAAIASAAPDRDSLERRLSAVAVERALSRAGLAPPGAARPGTPGAAP